MSKELGEAAKTLHDEVKKSGWIAETLSASGGLGGEHSSSWVFQVANYAALDRLLADREDRTSQAYNRFFSRMYNVRDRVREKVLFL